MITLAVVSFAIGIGGSCYGLGQYVERLKWNKLIWEGKLPKPPNDEKRFGNPIVQGKVYDVAKA